MKEKNSTHWAQKQIDVVKAAFTLTGEIDKSSEKYLSYIFDLVGDVKSVCDLGCGLGLWLNAAKNLGAERIRGFDIPEIPVEKRKIPASCYTPADLSKELKTDERFDLAMSIEVAEHIPISSAEIFVKNLTSLSDRVVFGAALPYQGGMGHINENWIEYWAQIFKKEGYVCYDLFRQKFWHDTSIIYYYRQNTLFFVKEGKDEFLKEKGFNVSENPQTYIHPDMFIKCINRSLPSNQKNVWDDVNVYYDYARERNLEIQSKKDIIYGPKHLGWATISKEIK